MRNESAVFEKRLLGTWLADAAKSVLHSRSVDAGQTKTDYVAKRRTPYEVADLERPFHDFGSADRVRRTCAKAAARSRNKRTE